MDNDIKKSSISPTIYAGRFIQCKSLTELEIWEDAVVVVGGSDSDKSIGKILRIERAGEEGSERLIEKVKGEFEGSREEIVGGEGKGEVVVRRTEEGEFYFPGFIDTHIHASQYANAGIFGKSTLLSWLETYTFPMESSLTSLSKANLVYSTCIRRTLSHGTTTASYFATIDVAATNLLASLCLSLGQRAFVGRVCMDTLSPGYYRDESVSQCVSDTKACISHIKDIDPGYELISPIITPRFAPSCTRETLDALGTLHQETSLPIQTHISENLQEIELVKSLFPDSKSYTDVYDTSNLLTPKTILAHAVHLSQKELSLIKARKSKIAHCPLSNSSITSGMAKVRWMLDEGVDVGLGTDMSGGYSASILEAVRHALLVSRHVALGMEEGVEKERTKLSVEEGLWLGTRGGARVVGLEEKVGGFEVGMEWDVQLVGLGMVKRDGLESGGVKVSGEHGPVDIFGWETWEERVEKWVFAGDDRNTKAVWVKGTLVHER